jgi:apoptosis-inducing factor 2
MLLLMKNSLQFPTSLPNADYHFAAGDIVHGPGIKRSGPAQNMGKIAATNIVQLLLGAEDNEPVTEFAKVTNGPPAMSLAIGEQAMTLRGGGVRWGKEIKERAFGRGLGIEGIILFLKSCAICLETMLTLRQVP